jgi:hypothetical protein
MHIVMRCTAGRVAVFLITGRLTTVLKKSRRSYGVLKHLLLSIVEMHDHRNSVITVQHVL